MADRRRPRRLASRRLAPPPVAAPATAGGRSRLGLVLAILVGIWVGQTLSNISGAPGDILDVLLVGATAITIALIFRRQARSYVETHRPPPLPGGEE